MTVLYRHDTIPYIFIVAPACSKGEKESEEPASPPVRWHHIMAAWWHRVFLSSCSRERTCMHTCTHTRGLFVHAWIVDRRPMEEFSG